MLDMFLKERSCLDMMAVVVGEGHTLILAPDSLGGLGYCV